MCARTLEHEASVEDRIPHGLHSFDKANASELQVSIVTQALGDLALKEATDRNVTNLSDLVSHLSKASCIALVRVSFACVQ